MTEAEYKKLLDGFLKGESSLEEKKLLDDFFEAHKMETHGRLDNDSPINITKDTGERMFGNIEASINKKAKRTRGDKTGKVAVLVSLGFICLAACLWILFQSDGRIGNGVEMRVMEAGHGERITVMLEDGTRVRLNSGSTLSYPVDFGEDVRRVALTGEAFFEVTPDSSRPFMIETGEIRTLVLGTSFNVNAFEGSGTYVTVVSGKVKVGSGTQEVLLTKGTQAYYNREENSLSSRIVDPGQSIAWLEGRLIFSDLDLAEAFGVLERWYGVSFYFSTEGIQGCRVFGDFNNQPLESIMETLGFINGIEYRFLEDGSVEVTGSLCE